MKHIIACGVLHTGLSCSRKACILLIDDHDAVFQMAVFLLDQLIQDLHRIVLRSVIDKDELHIGICLSQASVGTLTDIFLYAIDGDDY
jgi:hypothetical protein